jgi:pantetheine-phosphate adenylyltransferase
VRLFDELIVAVYDRPLKSLLFPPEIRFAMVEEAFKHESKIRVIGYSGLTVAFCREIDAKVIVRGLRVFSDFEYEFRMALANQELAPEIETVSLITSKEHSFLSSTTVREIASLDGDVSSMVPPHVERTLKMYFKEYIKDKDQFATNSLRD